MNRLAQFLFSSKLTLACLIAFALAMGTATFIENDFGTQTARTMVYDAFWFELLMLVLGLNFIGNIFKYKLWRKQKWPILLFHLAFILILVGAAVTRYTGYEGVMRIREGESSNTIISDRNYLQLDIPGGRDTIRFKEELYFSPLKDNEFQFMEEIDKETIAIKYVDFIPDAEQVLVPAPGQGDNFIELVMGNDQGRKSIYLKKGVSKTFGALNNSISYNGDPLAEILIKESDSGMILKGTQDIDVFNMISQTGGKIPKQQWHKLEMNALHRSGNLSFVPVAYHENSALKWVSGSAKPKDNDDAKLDILKIEVAMGSASRQVSLPYKHGFLPEFQSLQLNSKTIRIGYGALPLKSPFQLRLRDFQLERYPGSVSPSAYASEVTIIDEEGESDYRIFMNNVLDHKGYRFFQASYDSDEQGTVLSVNHDRPGTILSYIGYVLMGLGMLLSLLWKGSRFELVRQKLNHLRSASTIMVLLVFINGAAQSPTDDAFNAAEKIPIIPKVQASAFGHLLVQDLDGRIKPINTLSSEFLRKLSRKRGIVIQKERLDPDQVFLSLHMAPELWTQVPLIKIDKKKGGDLLQRIPTHESSLAAFNALLDQEGNYLLESEAAKAHRKKPAERSEMDNEIIKVDERFNILFHALNGNYIKIFPKKDDPTKTWYAPNYHFNDFNEENAGFCRAIVNMYFNDLRNGIESGNWEAADENLSYIAKYQQVLAADLIPDGRRRSAEILYNKLNLNFWLFLLYFILGTLLLLVSLARIFSNNSFLMKISSFLLVMILLAFLAHASNLMLRWYVADYPPWSNGYEMIVFVAWALMLFGLLFQNKSEFVLPLATLFSGTLLFVSYLDWLNPEITNLMPVLKSYWLKIHVAVIISSYAPLALSALLGLMTMVLLLIRSEKNASKLDVKTSELTCINELSMTIGLYLLSIGTFLGGVWANESWGRYWAWDPKETWALVSIIVYAAVLHMRLVPKLNDAFIFNVSSVYAFSSIVMTSFGVNYYLTGLHSYATGDPVPIPGFVYLTVGLIFALTILSFWRKKQIAGFTEPKT